MAAGVGASGFGAAFAYASAATSTTFTTFADLRDISPVGWSATPIDITHHSSPSGTKEFIAGLLDGGETSVTLSYVKDEFLTLQTAWAGKTKRNYKATLQDGTTVTFSAIITGLDIKNPIDDVLETEIKLKVSGLPVAA